MTTPDPAAPQGTPPYSAPPSPTAQPYGGPAPGQPPHGAQGPAQSPYAQSQPPYAGQPAPGPGGQPGPGAEPWYPNAASPIDPTQRRTAGTGGRGLAWASVIIAVVVALSQIGFTLITHGLVMSGGADGYAAVGVVQLVGALSRGLLCAVGIVLGALGMRGSAPGLAGIGVGANAAILLSLLLAPLTNVLLYSM